MQTKVDELLIQQAERFSLRFSCEHCAHFDEPGERCAEGYPNGEHRSARLTGRQLVVFCKSFELS